MKIFCSKNGFIYALLFSICSFSAKSQTDSLRTNQTFELSMGQSMLFISNSKLLNIRKKEAVVIPTSAILFFVEFRPQKKLRIPVFFNLPTETKQFLLNGQLVNERASPTFGFGVEYKVFQIKIDSKSRLDFEIGPLASFLMNNRNVIRVVPLIAGRIRVMRGENFVMYIGTSYSVGINSWGILYGTGTIF
ncbi:MAG: hypothetical protein V4608_00060 [Bacteroidota bacterium]